MRKFLPSAITMSIKVVSWEVNALVEATPISAPAFVNTVTSDSLDKELSGTLHTDKVLMYRGSFLISFNAAKVSAVSPDCEIVINNVSS